MGSVRLSGSMALLMGGEGAGISDQLLGKCTHKVSIPLAGRLESLNVSVAAAVLMYEKHVRMVGFKFIRRDLDMDGV